MKWASDRAILIVKVVGEVLFLYGLLAWLDGVVIQVVNPMWLAAPVSHLFLWLRTDTFTILSFIVSALGFFIWRLAVEMIKAEKTKQNIS
ncbi:MAG: hypothetical protein ABSD92_03035 [Candidatus Bathyarchaeia archaeon]|jgi:hypothetical protein